MSRSQKLTLNLHSGSDDPLALALRRACDRCRRRKTRCDGQTPCKSCIRAGRDCAYLTQPKPLGRRPRKAKTTMPKEPPPAKVPKVQHVELVQPTVPHIQQRIPLQNDILYPIIVDTPHQSPASSTGFVASATHSPDDNTHYPERIRSQPREIPVDFDFTTPSSTDWNSYPSLNPYAPTLEGSLPLSNGIEDLTTPSGVQHDFYAQDAFAQTPIDILPLLEKVPEKPEWTVPTSTFVPYVKLFFERLYPVFPVLDKESLPTEETHSDPCHRSWDRYAVLASLAAAVTIQLNIVGSQCVAEFGDSWSAAATSKTGEIHTADFWISQALEARKQWDFMSEPDEATIMTSFFLFEYYGNKNQAQRAWYYLREAIGFAIAIGLDDSDSYLDLEPKISQRRCRLFWLLFITERAYALQHKSSAMLRSTIDLPRIFESDTPKLIYGFVSLVNLFKAVDDKFLSLWKGGKPPAAASYRVGSSEKQTWQKTFYAALADQAGGGCEIVEIQRLDILVTQQWLHLLAWQMQMRKGEVKKGDRKFPFAISRDTLQIISKANRRSLESHGIGMEQKIFDIACCLSDVLESPNTRLDHNAVSMGHQYLHGFMTLLSSFRNQESQYLRPLLTRASMTLAQELQIPAPWPTGRPFDEIVCGWLENGSTRESSEGVEMVAA